MNNLSRIVLLLFVFASCLHCQKNSPSSTKEVVDIISFVIKNPTNQDWTSETFEVSTDFLAKDQVVIDWSKISFSDSKNLPFQLIDEDGNGTPESVLISADIKANGEKEIEVTFTDDASNNTFEKRTQAEISHKVGGVWEDRKYKGGTFKNVNALRVPPEHTDHSQYIRYEGPGWESDLVGYRFYLDWRNAVDIFGKKTPQMVLQKVGLDGFDSYHEPADWGMDVLKVGGSLGIGSIGFWENGKATRVEKTDSLYFEILQNGILQSKIQTTYFGWQINNQKLDLIADLSIQAGSRLTRQDIVTTAALPNLCTGIVKHENGELITQIPTDTSPWGYIATYGKQSLADDNLGMMVFFQGKDLAELQEDKESHVVVLKPKDNKLTYFFGAAWEQEPQAMNTLEKFKEYLDQQAEKLNTNFR